MNNNHYPSLELCKKLKEIGFPSTQTSILDKNTVLNFEYEKGNRRYNNYPCPSVMEMLDMMPQEIKGNEFDYILKMTSTWCGYEPVFSGPGRPPLCNFAMNILPNALAEMIIWLVENNYLKLK